MFSTVKRVARRKGDGMSRTYRDKHVEGKHYTWGTRPKRLADKRSIHANRSRLRQSSRQLIQNSMLDNSDQL